MKPASAALAAMISAASGKTPPGFRSAGCHRNGPSTGLGMHRDRPLCALTEAHFIYRGKYARGPVASHGRYVS